MSIFLLGVIVLAYAAMAFFSYGLHSKWFNDDCDMDLELATMAFVCFTVLWPVAFIYHIFRWTFGRLLVWVGKWVFKAGVGIADFAARLVE